MMNITQNICQISNIVDKISQNINIASDFCFIQILNIVAKILDISNVA